MAPRFDSGRTYVGAVEGLVMAPGPEQRWGSRPRKFVLRGLATCALCGCRLVPKPRGHDKGAIYSCTPASEGIGSCGRVGAVANALEYEIAEQVFAVLEGEGLARALERAADKRPDVEQIRADERRLSSIEVAQFVGSAESGGLPGDPQAAHGTDRTQPHDARLTGDCPCVGHLAINSRRSEGWWDAAPIDGKGSYWRQLSPKFA